MKKNEREKNASNPEESQFSPKQLKAIEVLSDPTDTRTQGDIARDIKVRPETISRWKKLPGFMEEVCRRLDEKRQHVRPMIWKTSYRHAVDRSVHDRRLLMEAVGDIKAKHEHSGDVHIVIDWGPESPEDRNERT